MRITNQMMVNTLKMNISTNTQRMAVTQEQIASGKKINKVSDDPGSLVQVMRIRGNVTENKQYVRNLAEAVSFLDTADSALDDLTAVMQRVRELTVKAANETNDKSALEAVADEIEILKGQVRTIANISYSNKYIFAGTNVTEAPCGDTEWTGNGKSLTMEISVGATLSINIDMREIFGSPTGLDEYGNPDGGIFDLFDQIITDIHAEDAEAISANLDIMDQKIDDILSKRSTVGARANRLELQLNRMEDEKVSLKTLLSKREDADITDLAIDLQMQENVYTASLSAGAKIIMPSLLDFLS
ncbi:flagellar hook-associated protein flgl [hydrocarbon metagenome]|uniref:Flagellar hook-associated protein flgl n=1 Tax=hydrocarbon metagenome TaxID=938273 RepID=A0A0W8E149_9ZZZZ